MQNEGYGFNSYYNYMNVIHVYLMLGGGLWSLLDGRVLFSKLEELVEVVWYCGGGGGSLLGKPRGWTILIGLSLLVIVVVDEARGWLTWLEICTADGVVCFAGWFVWVIVITLGLHSVLGGWTMESKSNFNF